MNLSNIDISAALESREPEAIDAIKNEIYGIRTRIKRAWDSGLDRSEALNADALITVCDMAERALDNYLQVSRSSSLKR